ncbi:MAG: hypothetical protein EU541_00750 [Promethearchaeota archaeon]|nr:MAG: hypothetical protein EU541_00750 [Candidatus Lokiarchaeota archaeon]
MKFLLLSKKITEYTKKDIDRGFCPDEIYQICCCLRTCFCLSYAIRKYNDFYIYFIRNNICVKFIGSQLRFLGPDERSQALLLQKALQKRELRINMNIWRESTPGIYLKRFSDFNSFFKELWELNDKNIYVIDDKERSVIDDQKLHVIDKQMLDKEGIYILSLYDMSTSKFLLNHSLYENINIKQLILNNIKKIEDQILMINYWIDNKNMK